VQSPVDEDQMKTLLEGRDILPNAWFPSDHLPVGAAFAFKPAP